MTDTGLSILCSRKILVTVLFYVFQCQNCEVFNLLSVPSFVVIVAAVFVVVVVIVVVVAVEFNRKSTRQLHLNFTVPISST